MDKDLQNKANKKLKLALFMSTQQDSMLVVQGI